jgi:basic membrane protein A
MLLVAVALGASGCGGDDNAMPAGQTTPAATTAAKPQAAGPRLRVGLVTGPDADDPFAPRLARVGLRRAEGALRVDGAARSATSSAQFESALDRFAAAGYDLVLAAGTAARPSVEKVAARYPKVGFAVVGASQSSMQSRPANVRGLLFKEQEAGYLAGYLAGLLDAAEAGSRQTIGWVRGGNSESGERYVAGFVAGARKANPKITMLRGDTGSVVDPARCKELALSQIAQGSDVVFEVGGRCSLGALTAAAENNVWAIGVDADRSSLGPHVLTSAVRRVDVAVFETIADAQETPFTGGEDTLFDVASGGVGIGRISSDVPFDIVTRVQAVQDDLAAGKLTNIPDRLP